MSLPRYPAYKTSGERWPEIPNHWAMRPIKHLAVLKGGAGFPHEEQGKAGDELPFFKVNALANADAVGALMVSDDTVSRDVAKRLRAFVFPPKTLVLAKVGAALLLGRIRVLTGHACIDNNMLGLVVLPAISSAEFLRYALSLVKFDLLANPGAVPSIGAGDLGAFQLSIPPLVEQVAIAKFLDRETARIDALIGEQEHLIQLLHEKCQSIIRVAVTRGLDKNAPTKKSHVPWLGDVPAHWDVVQLNRVVQTKRRITYGIVQPGEPDQQGRFMVRGQDYSSGWVKPEEIFKVSDAVERPYKRARLAKGDLVITIVGAGVGNIGIVPDWLDGANITQTTARIAIDDARADAQFIAYILQSPLGRRSVELYAKGAAQPGLNLEHVRVFPITLPPLEEQRRLVRYLDEEITRLNALSAQVLRAIEILRERRAALVSAAVTGQIDVRGLVDQEAA